MFRTVNVQLGSVIPQLSLKSALLISLLFVSTAFAQRVTTINNKGTIQLAGNIVTEAVTAPTTPTPVQGDIWIDSTTNTTKFWDGDSWEPIAAARAFALIDNDGDTRITVEENTDEDVIRFYLGDDSGVTAAEYFRMTGPRLEVFNSGNSVFVGEGAGESDDLADSNVTAVGYRALQNNSGTLSNGIGYTVLQNNSGNNSNGVGYAALENNSGNSSNGVGYQALQRNTGDYSSGFGSQALQNNSGNHSIGVGGRALQNNTGSQSIGLGQDALRNNTGVRSNGIGYGALLNNTGAQSNGFGVDVLKQNTGAQSNGFGYEALQLNTGAKSNGFGYEALQHNTGAQSNGFGYEALQRNTGDNASGFGAYSLQNNTGDHNSAFGYEAFSQFSGSGMTATVSAVDAATNQMTAIGHSFGAIGEVVIAQWTETTPVGGVPNLAVLSLRIIDADILEIVDQNISSNGTGSLEIQTEFTNSTALGYNAEPDASNQVVLGNTAVTELVAGHYRFDLDDIPTNNDVLSWNGTQWTSLSTGESAGVSDADGDTRITVEETVDADRIQFNTEGTERMVIDTNGKVGMGTTAPKAALDITSTSAGVLIPRMDTATRTALSVAADQNAMMVYDTDTNSFWYYNHSGTTWVEIASGSILATEVVYDNATSGLTATDVQAAIDELSSPVARTLVLSAEYAGAVMSGDGSDNEVTLFADHSGSPDYRTYYEISNFETDSSVDDFDIVVRIRLPENFDSFSTTLNAIEVESNGTTDANASVTLYKSGTATALIPATTITGTGSASFLTTTLATSAQLTTLAAGDTLIVYAKLSVTGVATVGASYFRIADITLNYNVRQ